MKTDILSLSDIKLLVDSFYAEVQNDDLICGIFQGTIHEWPIHLEKMYAFWQTLLLEEHTYNGNPFPPHAQLSINSTHFKRWLSIWRRTVDNHFEGKLAEEAKWRAEKMATIFTSKLKFIRG